MVTIRAASVEDLSLLLPRTRALNDHEAIAITDDLLAGALRTLLADPSLGGAWLIERDHAPVGYIIATYGFDLEFGGRDAVLTEIFVDDPARGGGIGAVAIELVTAELASRGVRAVHLQVRRENRAMALYQRLGFAASPRVVMTKRLA